MDVLERFRLDGKRALITGGSRGLGRAMALALAQAGANIIITGRSKESLDGAATALRQTGREIHTYCADMADPHSCEATCQQLLAQELPIHILINNIGGRRNPAPLEEMSIAEWQSLMDLNLTATVICTKLIGTAMLKHRQGGRIINISSMNALVAGQNIGGRHYETAKAAILQFTRAIAVDWAPANITANAILPGLFMTEPNKRWAREKPEVINGIINRTPMAKGGDPEDIGALAVYLASDASRFMTGAGVVIDGGYTLV